MEKLSDRKKKIIQTLVDSYIENANPVSSSEIQKNSLSDFSSATIRSEMSALEDMGYLIQPYTSSGRVPSSKAYKYYVENCIGSIEKKKLLKDIKNIFSEKLDDIEDLMHKTAKLISDKTNYTAILYKQSDNSKETLIENIKMIDLNDEKALVIIYTNKGILHQNIIDIPNKLQKAYLDAINDSMNQIFRNIKLKDIDNLDYKNKIDNKLKDFAILFDKIYKIIKKSIDNKNSSVILEGRNKIFEYKEYEDINNVKNFLQVIDQKEKLQDIMKAEDNNIELSIKIGKDEEDCLNNMAIVSATCRISENEIVRAGVIGPQRMDYKKVTEVLTSIKDMLIDILNKK